MDRIIGTEATVQALSYSTHCATLYLLTLNCYYCRLKENRNWENKYYGVYVPKCIILS